MPKTINQSIHAYTKAKENGYARGFLAFLRENNPYCFAHHPASPQFRNHLWAFRGFYLCKGCLLSASGILLGFIFFGLTSWLYHFNTSQSAIIFTALLLPTIISTRWKLPQWARYLSRILLGFLTASAFCFLWVTDHLFARIIVITTFFLARFYLGRYRTKMNQRIAAEKTCSQ